MKKVIHLSITTVFLLFGFSVFTQPVVSFVPSQMVACAPANISFTNTTTGCIGTPTFYWEAGNGDVSNVENPSFYYSSGGNYTVALTVNCDGYDITMAMEIIVQELHAEFNLVENNFPCYPVVPEIEQMSSVIPSSTNLNYEWVMGQGDTINVEDPEYFYTSPGVYTIILNVSTDAGCEDSYSQSITIEGPYAEVLVSDNSVCVGQEINFEIVNLQNVVDFIWMVGGGASYTDVVFTHSYDHVPPEGYFPVSLILSSDDCEINFVWDIFVFDLPSEVFVTGGGQYYGYPVELNASGGDGGTIYWQNTNSEGISTALATTSQSVSETGTYYFRSMSEQECWGPKGSAFVEIIDSIDIEMVITPATAENSPDASVQVIVTGGVEPYTITCSQAKSSQNFTDLLPGTYTVQVTDFLGNSESETFVVGWADSDLNNCEFLSIYPNPAKGLVAINSGNQIPVKIQIVNLSGSLISIENPNSGISLLDVSSLETGIYFITITFKDKTVTQKIIINADE